MAAPEDTNPPTEDPPKEDPPKEDPPKEDPPKEDPPKDPPPQPDETITQRLDAVESQQKSLLDRLEELVPGVSDDSSPKSKAWFHRGGKRKA